MAAVVGSITMCAIKSWSKSQRFQRLTKEKVRSSHLFYLVGFPLPATQVNVLSIYHSKAKLQGVRGLAWFLDTLITSSSTMTTTSEVVMMQNQLPFVKLGSFSSFTGVLTRIHSRALVSKVQL